MIFLCSYDLLVQVWPVGPDVDPAVADSRDQVRTGALRQDQLRHAQAQQWRKNIDLKKSIVARLSNRQRSIVKKYIWYTHELGKWKTEGSTALPLEHYSITIGGFLSISSADFCTYKVAP